MSVYIDHKNVNNLLSYFGEPNKTLSQKYIFTGWNVSTSMAEDYIRQSIRNVLHNKYDQINMILFENSMRHYTYSHDDIFLDLPLRTFFLILILPSKSLYQGKTVGKG